MAIAPSKLGRFVVREGFSWPTHPAEAAQDFATADEALVRRLREAGLVRTEATDDEIAGTFQDARSEHAIGGYSTFNSPHERVRVFLAPYLTPEGLRWAEPLRSLDLPEDDAGPLVVPPPPVTLPELDSEREVPSWWKFWRR